MKGSSPIYLRKIRFAKWENNSSFWECSCICGKKVLVDIRRIRHKEYRSCGCIKNVNSKSFYFAARRRFFQRISKQGDHWIYKTDSKSKKSIRCNFKGKGYTIQRMAYLYWNHLNFISKEFVVNNICKNKYCISPAHLRILTTKEHNKEMKKLETWRTPWSKKRGKDGINNSI